MVSLVFCHRPGKNCLILLDNFYLVVKIVVSTRGRAWMPDSDSLTSSAASFAAIMANSYVDHAERRLSCVSPLEYLLEAVNTT